MALLLLVFHFGIRNRGLAYRAPVHHTVALVNPSLLMHLYEGLGHGLVAALVHGEALTIPVAGRSQLLQLLHNAVTILFAPLPALLKKALTAKICLGDALLLQLIDDLYLGCNGGMVGPGLPQCIIALHSLKADDDVLHRLIQRMSHVELTGNVRRRDHNRKRKLRMIHLRMKILLLFPVLVNPVLNGLRIVGL
ncbi:uncharacterized protein BN785_00852 [Firmicutes bacterium CAG:791]|nr:uncharacterized protein BN785_00852 [Firmicutes bacterium CAG:791]